MFLSWTGSCAERPSYCLGQFLYIYPYVGYVDVGRDGYRERAPELKDLAFILLNDVSP